MLIYKVLVLVCYLTVFSSCLSCTLLSYCEVLNVTRIFGPIPWGHSGPLTRCRCGHWCTGGARQYR